MNEQQQWASPARDESARAHTHTRRRSTHKPPSPPPLLLPLLPRQHTHADTPTARNTSYATHTRAHHVRRAKQGHAYIPRTSKASNLLRPPPPRKGTLESAVPSPWMQQRRNMDEWCLVEAHKAPGYMNGYMNRDGGHEETWHQSNG